MRGDLFMKFMIAGLLLLSAASASATSLLECYPRSGKFDIQQIVVAYIVIQPREVTMFQQVPVFESVSFNPKTAKTELTRTGNWVSYELVRELDQEIITLQMEEVGKVRRAYLKRESTPFSQNPYFDFIALKCFEQE
jgi:hypothetical protein